MAKGRFLNRSISDSADLADLTWKARELFLMAIPHLDREGRIHAEPRRFRALVCPLLEHQNGETITAALIELAKAGMVILYRDDRGQPAAYFPSFETSQPGLAWKKKESPSGFGPPPPQLPEPCPDLLQRRRQTNSDQESDKDSGPTPDLLRSDSDKGSDKGSAQRKGKEEKRSEVKRAGARGTHTALQADMDPLAVAMMNELMAHQHLPSTITEPKAARHLAEQLLGQLKTPRPVEWLIAAIRDAVADLPECPSDQAARTKIRIFVKNAKAPRERSPDGVVDVATRDEIEDIFGAA